jgi:hypothetical protein
MRRPRDPLRSMTCLCASPQTAWLPDCRTARQSQPLQPPASEDLPSKACPSMLASFPASMVNQKCRDLGNPNRIKLTSSRFS